MASTAMSAAANSFSVVGLADAVFRLGLGIFDTLSKMKRAPQEVTELLDSVRDFQAIIARTRIFLSELESSGHPKKNAIIPPIKVVLSQGQHELFMLKIKTDNMTQTTPSGVLTSFMARTAWVLGQREISKSSLRIQNLRRDLDTELTLAGRYSDVAVCTEMQILRNNLTEMRSTLEVEFSTIQNHSRCLVDTVRVHQDAIFAKFLRTLDDRDAKLEQKQIADPSFVYFGTNPESIPLPLQILRMHTAGVLLPIGISLTVTKQIQNRLELLLAESYDVSAKLIRSSQAEDSARIHGLPNDKSAWSSHEQFNSFPHHICEVCGFNSHESDMGTITVRILRQKPAYASANGFSTLQLLFLPRPEFSSIGIAGLSVKMWPFSNCDIAPHVFTWNVMPWDSEAFFKVKKNDVYGLRELFGRKQSCPFDTDSFGNSLLFLAILFESIDVFDFLIGQGAAKHESGRIPLSSFLLVGMSYASSPTKFPVVQRMVASALAHGADFDEAHGFLALLGKLYGNSTTPVEPTPLLSKFCEFLIHLETAATSFLDEGCLVLDKSSPASNYFHEHPELSSLLDKLGIRLRFQHQRRGPLDSRPEEPAKNQFGLLYLAATPAWKHTMGLPELLNLGLHTERAIDGETGQLRRYAKRSLACQFIWREFRQAHGVQNNELVFTGEKSAQMLWKDIDARCQERPFRRFIKTNPMWSPESVLSRTQDLRRVWHYSEDALGLF